MGDKTTIDRCQQFIIEVNRTFPVLFAYLFGSRARGRDRVLSDIDIALMFVRKYTDTDDVFIRGDIIEAGQEFFNIPVDIINLAKSSLLQQYEVVQHGIVLVGKDSTERMEYESLTFNKISIPAIIQTSLMMLRIIGSKKVVILEVIPLVNREIIISRIDKISEYLAFLKGISNSNYSVDQFAS